MQDKPSNDRQNTTNGSDASLSPEGMVGVMADRVRNLQPGQRFRLKRTGDLYEFLGHKRGTPGGTQYVVRRSGFAKPSTLHHSCHVVLIQDDPS